MNEIQSTSFGINNAAIICAVSEKEYNNHINFEKEIEIAFNLAIADKLPYPKYKKQYETLKVKWGIL